MYEVFDNTTHKSHGTFDTLDEARGCVAFDGLTDYDIIQDKWIVVFSTRLDGVEG